MHPQPKKTIYCIEGSSWNRVIIEETAGSLLRVSSPLNVDDKMFWTGAGIIANGYYAGSWQYNNDLSELKDADELEGMIGIHIGAVMGGLILVLGIALVGDDASAFSTWWEKCF